MHVLLVEDDPILSDGISRALRSHGMSVDVLDNGLAAASFLQHAEVAVVILDIGLPGIDGFEVVRRMRVRGSAIPVLLLTARDAIQDRVHGLELGADDYLVKPFATAELVARVRALSRRGTSHPVLLHMGRLVLDTTAKRARIGDQPLELSAREWGVLEYLMRQTTRVVSKQQIIDAILPWGEELTLNAVEVYVSRVRVKVADAGVSIRAIRGFGYMIEHLSEQVSERTGGTTNGSVNE